MDRAYKTCHDILVTHRDQLEIVAQYLIRKEKVDADTFVKLMTGEITLEDIHKMDEQEAQEKHEKKHKQSRILHLQQKNSGIDKKPFAFLQTAFLCCYGNYRYAGGGSLKSFTLSIERSELLTVILS